jgi:hypothetical protein
MEYIESERREITRNWVVSRLFLGGNDGKNADRFTLLVSAINL